MKLNRIERLVVNNPLRRASQYLEIQWLYRKMPLTVGANILEIGCGQGAGAQLINAKFKPKMLFLLDLDIQMIRKARRYLGAGNNKNTSYCTARATFLPFHNGSFDAIFGFGFLHHVLEWQNSLKEIARVLHHGGIYYMLELYPALYQNFLTRRLLVHPTRNRFNGPELKKELQDVGLDLAHSFEIKHMGILGIGIKN